MRVRVLVVDDQPLIGRALKRLLDTTGADVVVLDEPTELATLLDTSALEIVLSDLLMPVLDGVQVLRMVKERMPSARRYLITATRDFLTPADLEDLQGVVIVEKPWDDDSLLASLGLTRRR